jgi:hypothetical protein
MSSLLKTTVLSPAIGEAMPATLLDRAAKDAGRGVSFDQADQLLPLIYLLQTNSPCCDRNSPDYLENAQAGDLWLRNAVDPIRDGTAGILVIPCGMDKVSIEWLPNRQGLVTVHADPPDDLQTRSDPNRNRPGLVRANSGNIIEETRQFYVLCEGQPYILPCASTKNTFAREWNSYFRQFRHPRTGSVLPSFSRRYRLLTAPAHNAKGHWFAFKFADEGWVTPEEYDAAKALAEIIERGGRRGDYSKPDAA